MIICAGSIRKGRAPISRKSSRRATPKGIKVLLAGMVGGANFGVEHKQAFDDIFPQLAKERGLPLYPFFLDGVLNAPGMTLPDGLHPSRAGVERIVAGIAPLVEKTLDQIRAEKGGGAAR